MTPRFYGRTEPSPSPLWHRQPVVGAIRRAPLPRAFWFAAGLLLGMALALLA